MTKWNALRVELATRANPIVGEGTIAPDIYFGGSFGLASATQREPLWCGLSAFDGAWQMPVLTESSEPHAAASPYGYAGIYSAATISRKDQLLAFTEAMEALRDQGVTTVFIRRSPLVPQMELPDPVPWTLNDHTTYLVQAGPTESLWANLRPACRTSIRKAQRLGVDVTLRAANPSDLDAKAPFRQLYDATMSLRSASENYLFDDGYYQRLLGATAARTWIGQATNSNGDVVAAALFLHGPDVTHYHLSGGTREAGQTGATNLLIWKAICHASEIGSRGLYLGGGVSTGDGLDRFKASFGGRALAFSAAGLIVNHQDFKRRTIEEATRSAETVESVQARKHFPPYAVSA